MPRWALGVLLLVGAWLLLRSKKSAAQSPSVSESTSSVELEFGTPTLTRTTSSAALSSAQQLTADVAQVLAAPPPPPLAEPVPVVAPLSSAQLAAAPRVSTAPPPMDAVFSPAPAPAPVFVAPVKAPAPAPAPAPVVAPAPVAMTSFVTPTPAPAPAPAPVDMSAYGPPRPVAPAPVAPPPTAPVATVSPLRLSASPALTSSFSSLLARPAPVIPDGWSAAISPVSGYTVIPAGMPVEE